MPILCKYFQALFGIAYMLKHSQDLCVSDGMADVADVVYVNM
jgi:hypothetical protein